MKLAEMMRRRLMMEEEMTEGTELDGVNMIAGMVDRMPDRVAAGEAEMLYEYNVRDQEGDMEATKVKEEATEDDMVAETMEGKDNAVCVLGATTPISARNWRITVWREI